MEQADVSSDPYVGHALSLGRVTRKPPAMEKPLGHEALASIVLLETHRFVDRAADEAMMTLVRPPSPRTKGPSAVAQPPALPSPLSDEVRNAITGAADEMKRGTTLVYPPSEEARLTDEEIAALSALHLPTAARSALRKIIRAAASTPLFRTFCLLDAVGDPELTRVATWLPVNLEPASADRGRAMMHDEFANCYSQYSERCGREGR